MKGDRERLAAGSVCSIFHVRTGFRMYCFGKRACCVKVNGCCVTVYGLSVMMYGCSVTVYGCCIWVLCYSVWMFFYSVWVLLPCLSVVYEYEDVPLVACVYPVFSHMPGGITIGDLSSS